MWKPCIQRQLGAFGHVSSNANHGAASMVNILATERKVANVVPLPALLRNGMLRYGPSNFLPRPVLHMGISPEHASISSGIWGTSEGPYHGKLVVQDKVRHAISR